MLTLNKTRFLEQYYHYYLLLKYFNFIKINNFYTYILFYKSLFIFFRPTPLKYFSRLKLDIITLEKFPYPNIWSKTSPNLLLAINGLIIRKSIYGRLKNYYKIKDLRILLGKFKAYKSLSPIIRRYNILKYVNFYKLISLLKKSKNYFPLRNRIFLNKKFIKKSITHFFYKKIKFKITVSDVEKTILKKFLKKSPHQLTKKLFTAKVRNSLVCLNIHKKFYWKIRKSRIAHWDSLVGNRLNKYRYAKFIKKTMKLKNKLSPNNLYILFISHLSGVVCSWRQLYLLIDYQLVVVNSKFYPSTKRLERGDIIEVCYGWGLDINFDVQSYFNFKIYYRLKRWSYRNSLNYDLPKNKKIFKKVPKSIKSLLGAYKNHAKSLMYSRSMGLVAVIYTIPQHLYEPSDMLYKTTILKLNHWRYKF